MAHRTVPNVFDLDAIAWKILEASAAKCAAVVRGTRQEDRALDPGCGRARSSP